MCATVAHPSSTRARSPVVRSCPRGAPTRPLLVPARFSYSSATPTRLATRSFCGSLPLRGEVRARPLPLRTWRSTSTPRARALPGVRPRATLVLLVPVPVHVLVPVTALRRRRRRPLQLAARRRESVRRRRREDHGALHPRHVLRLRRLREVRRQEGARPHGRPVALVARAHAARRTRLSALGSLVSLRAPAWSRSPPLSGPAMGTAPCQQGSSGALGRRLVGSAHPP